MVQKLLISLDYELFFGNKTGSVSKCMIEPINALVKVVERHGMKLSLFVDAGYLDCLKKHSLQYPVLLADFSVITQQLQSLKDKGHDVQLHIHPHWVDSVFNGTSWQLDTTRYRLHDFQKHEIAEIVARYKNILVDIVGDTVFSYRAGGWCMQPFGVIADALHAEGIWLDSTVFTGGVSEDSQRWFDFSKAPDMPFWRFDADPNIDDKTGRFVEVPISSDRVSPLLFWKMAVIKKLTKGQHQPYGDGEAMKANWQYYFKRLTSSTYSVVSIDGIKAGLLKRAWDRHLKGRGSDIFNIMGHPKAVTSYSLVQLDRFLGSIKGVQACTFQDLKHLRPG